MIGPQPKDMLVENGSPATAPDGRVSQASQPRGHRADAKLANGHHPNHAQTQPQGPTHGHTHGHTNGHTNGYTNSYTNSYTNGYTNGNTNGNTNGHHGQDQEQMNGSFSSVPRVVNGPINVRNDGVDATAQVRPVPDPFKQKQIVQRLMLSRRVGTAPHETKPGEAFYLIDWQWWKAWCRHVDFFYDVSGIQGGEDHGQARVQQILNLLPAGAILPSATHGIHHASSDGTDSSGTDSDTDSDSDVRMRADRSYSPGPIDNSHLFASSQDNVMAQWYTTDHHQQLHHHPKHSPIRPNLVRGHHYEVVSREVYSVLRDWYGEETKPICRRSTQHGNIALYPHWAPPAGEIVLTDKRCRTCYAPGAPKWCSHCGIAHYCSRSCQRLHWRIHKVQCKANKVESIPWARAGCVGLSNLGNTCFMNSALQALSHAMPLTRYFLTEQFKDDINEDNPIGTGGKLAIAYHATIRALWLQGHSASSMSPTKFKIAISSFAPRFAGYQQHDAQEFLAFLLDGLHEDLNRIRRAPYVTMPDVTDGHNMAIAGAEAWDAHRRRNDSLVMDTLYGQFKSTCVCPRCSKVSVSFDNFNHISLEIPQKNEMVSFSVDVFRETTKDTPTKDKKPTRYGLRLSKKSTIADLRCSICDMSGIDPSKLIICTVQESQIRATLNERIPLGHVVPHVPVIGYEVAPYTNKWVHAIVRHLIHTKPNKKSRAKSAIHGFPLMLSFDAESTCNELWDDVWNSVHHLIDAAAPFGDEPDGGAVVNPEDFLKIRVVTENEEPVDLTGRDNASGEDNPENDNDHEDSPSDDASILQRFSQEAIKKVLGPGCTNTFLFLVLEWGTPLRDPEGDDEFDLALQPTVSLKNFFRHNEHPSLAKVKAQEQNARKHRDLTLSDCFDAFTNPEVLDSNNKWYCSQCKDHVRAQKTMKLWRLPNIMVVHLKRFEFKNTFRRDKLNTLVDFPLDGLDMGPHCAQWEGPEDSFVDPSVPSDYDLFAVVNHMGAMGGGHYTAYARKWDEVGISDEWRLFNDSSVSPVHNPQRDLVSSKAYVLFYRRRQFH